MFKLLTFFICLTPVFSANYIHEIRRSSEVLGAEAAYEIDHWGTVNFPPVPKYQINTHDPETQDQFISASVHKGSTPWDSYIWDRIVSLTPQNMSEGELVFVDIGANIGYFTLAAASMGYHVVAFEPMSRNARKLSQSIENNHFESRVRLYQNAVSDVSGETVALQETDVSNQGNGHIVPLTLDNGIYGLNYVSVVKLSDIMGGINAYIVKIDVEGYEANVLAGAFDWICNNVIKYIIIEISEVSKDIKNAALSSVVEFMKKSRYELFDVAVGSTKELSGEDISSLSPNVIFILKGDEPICH